MTWLRVRVENMSRCETDGKVKSVSGKRDGVRQTHDGMVTSVRQTDGMVKSVSGKRDSVRQTDDIVESKSEECHGVRQTDG